MAKYMQDSTDIQINEVSGTDNINFSFKSGNSIDAKIGNLADLETTDKNTIVDAINEVKFEKYSTTEKVIGKWINGKPLYRKVINTGQINLSTSTVEKDSGISDIDIVKDINLMLMFQNGNEIIWYKDWNISELSFDISTQKIIIIGTKNASFINSFVILEYTKTTD